MIVAGWPAGQPLDEGNMYAVQADLSHISHERIGNIKQRLGLKAINFSEGAAPSVQSPYLHVSYFSREWHQADPDFLPQTRFVGGSPNVPTSAPPDWLTAIPVEATAGANHAWQHFYRRFRIFQLGRSSGGTAQIDSNRRVGTQSD